jgi:hypothetical protein
MTTIELAKRVSRHLRTRDVGNLTAGDRLELAGEITAGLTEFFESAPDVWQRSTFSFRLPASRTVNLTLTDGSNVVAGVPFTNEDRGRSVTIAGNMNEWNEVIDTDKLLDDFSGTDGIYEATIWPDAIAIQDKVIKRMVSDPRLNEESWTLVRDERIKHSGDWRGFWNDAGFRRYGTPVRYAIEEGGQSQNSDLFWLIRLDPIPTAKSVLRFEALYYPNPVGFSDILNPVQLPVTDNHANLILIPLIEERLMASAMWVGDERVDQQISNRAAQARAELGRMVPDFGRQRNRVGTKRGY